MAMTKICHPFCKHLCTRHGQCAPEHQRVHRCVQNKHCICWSLSQAMDRHKDEISVSNVIVAVTVTRSTDLLNPDLKYTAIDGYDQDMSSIL